MTHTNKNSNIRFITYDDQKDDGASRETKNLKYATNKADDNDDSKLVGIIEISVSVSLVGSMRPQLC